MSGLRERVAETVKRLRAIAEDKRNAIMAVGTEEYMVPASDMTKLFGVDVELQTTAADELESLLALLEGDEEPALWTSEVDMEWIRDNPGEVVRPSVQTKGDVHFTVPLYTRPSSTQEAHLAPDAVEAARYVVATAEWISGEVDEDPEMAEKIERGAKIIHALLDCAPREPELFPVGSTQEVESVGCVVLRRAEGERDRLLNDFPADRDRCDRVANAKNESTPPSHAYVVCDLVPRRALNREEG